MAFDACMMRAVLSEYRREFPEAKIEKVLQPQNDEIDLVIHYGKVSRRLVFNVGPNAPRLQLSDLSKENPLKAPTFCMYLRKRLVGAKICNVDQPGFDRIAVFRLSGYDEMGFLVEMQLICEIMGKYANLILADAEGKILSALKVIDFAASTVRQILPGLQYRLPDRADKMSPLTIDREYFYSALAAFPQEKTGEKFITSVYSGIATQIARELVFRTTGFTDVPVGEIPSERFYDVFLAWQSALISDSYHPTLATDENGKPADYSYMPIGYLGSAVRTETFPTFAALFDRYFAEKDRIEHIHERAHDLKNILNNAVSRTERKLAIQREALADSERGEEYKRFGDLITANLYRIPKGAADFTAVDYYDETCPEVVITLDPMRSPAQNAQKMYKLYAKCKNAKSVLTLQIATWEEELRYLDSVRAFLEAAESEQDIMEIRDELYRFGYAAKMKGYQPPRKLVARPVTMKTSGGFTLLVGRNNVQNDHLTFRVAEKQDIWFHVKDLPGSHVILVTDGKEPSDRDYTEAASIAAGYSKATGAPVAVDYTRVKNIRKPSGAKPGFVIYKTNYTAFVTPAKAVEDVSGTARKEDN